MILRPYQKIASNLAIEYFRNKKDKKNRLISAPLGSGKSVIIADIAINLDNFIIFQPSVELLEQNYDKFKLLGGQATIFSASAKQKNLSKKMFATIGSIKNFTEEVKNLGIKNIIIDECHKGTNKKNNGMFITFLRLLGKDIKVLGFTATPFTNSVERGESLYENFTIPKILTKQSPKLFSDFLYNIETKFIVEEGFWKPIRYKIKKQDDSTLKLNSTKNDYTEESLTKWFIKNSLFNKITQEVLEQVLNGKKRILIFMNSVQEAENLQKEIKGSNVVSSKTNSFDRKRILDDFKQNDSDVKVLLNYGVLTTGFDCPQLDCLIYGRPTNSIEIYMQCIGRICRLYEDLEGIVIDYSGSVKRFGRIEDLNVEFIENFGWGLFNNERLLTGVRIDSQFIYKKDLIKFSENNVNIDYLIKNHKTILMPFGKYTNVPMEQIDKEYLEFCLKNTNFSGIYGKINKNIIENELFLRKCLIINKK
jgi:DNA repair protein RadD